MKDYTENEFERKKFIIKYIIDADADQINIIYADMEVVTVPYSAEEEERILLKMKKQVEENYQTVQNVQASLFSYKYARICFIIITVILMILTALFAGLAITSAGLSWLLYGPLAIASLSGSLLFKKATGICIDDKKELEEKINDYEKNLYFIQNSDYFSDEKLLGSDSIDTLPARVAYILGERVISGYNEVDAVNLNSISALSVDELKETKKQVEEKTKQLSLTPLKKENE